jgi:cob(I)alamin adenosyltransferase
MASSIYTRKGDSGTTSLFDGTRVSKAAARVEAYGTIDEANAWIATARSFVEDPLLDEVLEVLAHRFYNCSSNVAAGADPGAARTGIAEEDVAFLERAIDRMEGASGPIGGFVLPGGSRGAGLLHVARTVCRRAERLLCALGRDEPVDPTVLKFVNRASDALFAAARYANHLDGRGDALWDKDIEPPF